MTAKIISIASQKGGVSKTTTAVNVASCISMRASPILLVDCDPQNSSIDWLELMRSIDFQLFDFIQADEKNIEKIIKQNRGNYKYIIIDCAPRLEKVIGQIISLSDVIVTPVKIGALESWALDDFTQAVKHAQKINDGKPLHRVFLTEVDGRKRKLIRQTQSAIDDSNIGQLTTIHNRSAVIDAVSQGKVTIQMNDQKAIEEIERLTSQILGIADDIC